ncbi:MAG: 1,4-dihydroxy-2-naphthoate octaprenyltransferase [Nevskiales bacterium]
MPPFSVMLAATRPRFLPASILPILIGSAWGARAAGALDVTALLLALAATALVHAASNVYNDVSDDLLGTDRVNTAHLHPFSGGSRLIQDGLLSRDSMRRLALALAVLAIGVGLLLAWQAGPAVLGAGLVGGALGAAYSLPGLRLAGRGLGEATIAIAFGILPVTGAAWLQTGSLDAMALLLALPVSAWVAAIILANEIPDASADAATGKRTLAVRLGVRTPRLYAIVQGAGLLAGLACIVRQLLPAWTLAVFALLFATALIASRWLGGSHTALRRGIRATLAIHVIGSIALIAALLSPAHSG